MVRFSKAATAVGLVCFLLLHVFSPAQASPYGETTLLGFTFRFDGTEYNPATDESTWHYTVTGPMVSGPAYKDLSHWMIALCQPHTVPDASGRWERRHNPDPHHGLVGIKWDEEVSKTGSRSFYFVLKGHWAVTDAVVIAAKAGPNKALGVLPGPACKPDVCRVDYSITTRSDWRFLKPGTYAAPAARVQLHGESAVRLRFSGFGDAGYVADWSLSPPIVFEYSIGPTLADAEAFGWRSAHQFNDLEVVVPKHAVQDGAQVIVWLRAHVLSAHRSSDYEGGGSISIELLCDA